MKYLVYLAVAALVLFSVFYVVRSIRRQARGKCEGCGGDCTCCHKENR